MSLNSPPPIPKPDMSLRRGVPQLQEVSSALKLWNVMVLLYIPGSTRRVRDKADWFWDCKDKAKYYPNHPATLGYFLEKAIGKKRVIRSYKISAKS